MKKLLSIIGAILVLVLGAGGVHAVMNHNTNKKYDEAISKAAKHVKEHEWLDAQASYKDAAKAKQTKLTIAAAEQIVDVMNAEKIAGSDQNAAIEILDEALKVKDAVPVINTEIKSMKTELQKQLDRKETKKDNNSRSDLKTAPNANKNEQDKNNNEQKNDNPSNKDSQPKASEAGMTVAQARARLKSQGVDTSFLPDSEIQAALDQVAKTGKSLKTIATEMRW